jgi:hypothetical protein
METRNCQNCKKDFRIEPDDFGFYEKLKVPPPTWCPSCRFQRRALFRNERKLFRNTDAVTGKQILSLYPPESEYLIYEDSYWTGDAWDPLSYGVDFDRSRPFLAQFFELLQKVPKPRSAATNMVRSEYSANAADLKDCYLLFNSNVAEDCAYGNGIDSCKSCFDNSHLQYSERCYESFWLTKCYDTHFSSQCEDCVSVWFSKNCQGCTNCFGCINLRNKSYHFFNQPLSKEEYEKKIKELAISKWSELEKVKQQVHDFWLRYPVKYFQGIKNHDCSGEYITHSKNVKNSYLVREGEDLRYVQYGQVPPFKDSLDVSIGGMNAQLMYESVTCGWYSSELRFCFECWDGGIDYEYCMFCRGANHIFGSVGVHKGDYIILNKQYSKEEFFKLRDEIRRHMDDMPYVDAQGRVYKFGEFFPPEFSPFAYNDTVTPEHFPLSKEEILAFGGKWYETPKTEFATTMEAENLPDDIVDTADLVTKEIIACMECKRAYRIISVELDFLRYNKIPLPRFCVDCRHKKRISQRNSSKLYDRSCACEQTGHDHVGKCQNEFQTSYAPDRPEIVYCEGCYQKEVI